MRGSLTDGGIFIQAAPVLLRDAEDVADLVEGALAVEPGYRRHLSGWYNVQWLLRVSNSLDVDLGRWC